MINVKGGYERVFAKINLDAALNNFNNIVSSIDDNTKVLAVLKTDAYGHGAVPIARLLENQSKLYGFALATAEEALILRNSGIIKPLLVLGYTFPSSYENLILKDVSFTVFREDMLEDLARVCRNLSSTEYQYKVKVHIKVDTGMGRIGITPSDDGIEFVRKVMEYPEIQIEGLFTHLAKADEKDRAYTEKQIKIFKDFANRIEEELGIKIPYKHISNSAGIIEYREANMDLVRAGIILYGLWPSNEVSKEKISLKPVLSLHSKIVYIKKIPPGTSISYGGTFISDKDMVIATVPIGYGEGYPRSLSNKAEVLIRGQRCKILGRICMDQLMVDVTGVEDVAESDTVTLIGQDGSEYISMEELGEISGRFNYEMACDFGKRIPRVFTQNNKILYTKDYYEDF